MQRRRARAGRGHRGHRRGSPRPTPSGNLHKRVPLGRFASIDEITEAVLFLVSPAGGYVTGATLLMDGGTSLMGGGSFFDMMGA